jgi:hypothetical protein
VTEAAPLSVADVVASYTLLFAVTPVMFSVAGVMFAVAPENAASV